MNLLSLIKQSPKVFGAYNKALKYIKPGQSDATLDTVRQVCQDFGFQRNDIQKMLSYAGNPIVMGFMQKLGINVNHAKSQILPILEQATGDNQNQQAQNKTNYREMLKKYN